MFTEPINVRGRALNTSTVREFDGGWNVVDSDLNLSAKYAVRLDNIFRGESGNLQKRYGTRAFAAGDDGVVTDHGSVSLNVVTTSTSNIVQITDNGHGLLTGDHITIDSFSADIGGIAAAEFNKSFEITYANANAYTIRTTVNATSNALDARTFNKVTSTHTISGVIVDQWYYKDHIVLVDTRGEVFKVDGTGVVTKIFSDNFARGLSGGPLPWSPMTFASAAVFKGDLILCNGLDKPLLVNLDNTPEVVYLQDLGTGTNANVPVCRYVIAMPKYLVMAGDPINIDRIHISNQSTSGTWQGDLPPNDATTVDMGQYSPSFDQTIRSVARFRGFLLVIFEDSIVPVSLGVYDSSGNHTPTIDDSIERHGTISHRSVVSLGNDLLLADHIGVPSIAQAAISNVLRPSRVSELIDPAIQNNVLRLSIGYAEDRVFAVYNSRDRQYMMFMPDYEEGATKPIPYNSMETQAAGDGTIRVFMATPHQLEVGKMFAISGAVTFDGILAGELNTMHTVTTVLSDYIFEFDTGGSAANGAVNGGGGSAIITYMQNETIGYIYSSYATRKVKAWSRFRGWNWRCGCSSQLGRVFLAEDRRIYVYGSREDPVSGDKFNEYDAIWANNTAYTVGDRIYDPTWGRVYLCTEDHTSSAAATTFAADRITHSDWWEDYDGLNIDFVWELPWADFDRRMELKVTHYVALDTRGTSPFTLLMFVDRLYEDQGGTRTPTLQMVLMGGDVSGFGGHGTSHGSGNLATEERPWPWRTRCKIAKARVEGSSNQPLSLIALSIAYSRGSLNR